MRQYLAAKVLARTWSADGKYGVSGLREIGNRRSAFRYRSCGLQKDDDQESKTSLFAGLPVVSDASGAGSGVPGSRKRLVIG
jgi:hypothetical protein